MNENEIFYDAFMQLKEDRKAMWTVAVCVYNHEPFYTAGRLYKYYECDNCEIEIVNNLGSSQTCCLRHFELCEITRSAYEKIFSEEV